MSAPGHPSTNGQAENVKTFKKSLEANINSLKRCDIATIISRILFDYRNTVHCTTGETPSKLLFGRSLRTRFSNLKQPTTLERIEEKLK